MQLSYDTGERRYQFSSRDMKSRRDVMDLSTDLTSDYAEGFLDTLEEVCQKRGIKLFVLPPRSPKLNGYVERSNRTHREEYYQVYETPLLIDEQRARLKQWQHIYNCIRPHQSLNDKTQLQFLIDSDSFSEKPPSAHLSYMSCTCTVTAFSDC